MDYDTTDREGIGHAHGGQGIAAISGLENTGSVLRAAKYVRFSGSHPYGLIV